MLVRVCVINWWLDELPFVWINLPVVTCNVGEVRRSGLSREREREREREALEKLQSVGNMRTILFLYSCRFLHSAVRKNTRWSSWEIK